MTLWPVDVVYDERAEAGSMRATFAVITARLWPELHKRGLPERCDPILMGLRDTRIGLRRDAVRLRGIDCLPVYTFSKVGDFASSSPINALVALDNGLNRIPVGWWRLLLTEIDATEQQRRATRIYGSKFYMPTFALIGPKRNPTGEREMNLFVPDNQHGTVTIVVR